jgi:hypothetical protein
MKKGRQVGRQKVRHGVTRRRLRRGQQWAKTGDCKDGRNRPHDDSVSVAKLNGRRRILVARDGILQAYLGDGEEVFQIRSSSVFLYLGSALLTLPTFGPGRLLSPSAGSPCQGCSRRARGTIPSSARVSSWFSCNRVENLVG